MNEDPAPFSDKFIRQEYGRIFFFLTFGRSLCTLFYHASRNDGLRYESFMHWMWHLPERNN